MKRYLLMNIGCIECGVSSAIVGFYEREEDALAAASKCEEKLSWREGGQNSFEVFDTLAAQRSEYAEVLK